VAGPACGFWRPDRRGRAVVASIGSRSHRVRPRTRARISATGRCSRGLAPCCTSRGRSDERQLAGAGRRCRSATARVTTSLRLPTRRRLRCPSSSAPLRLEKRRGRSAVRAPALVGAVAAGHPRPSRSPWRLLGRSASRPVRADLQLHRLRRFTARTSRRPTDARALEEPGCQGDQTTKIAAPWAGRQHSVTLYSYAPVGAGAGRDHGGGMPCRPMRWCWRRGARRPACRRNDTVTSPGPKGPVRLVVTGIGFGAGGPHNTYATAVGDSRRLQPAVSGFQYHGAFVKLRPGLDPSAAAAPAKDVTTAIPGRTVRFNFGALPAQVSEDPATCGCCR